MTTTDEPAGLANTPERFLIDKSQAFDDPPVSPEWGSRAGMAAAARGRHPGTVQLVRYFAFAHLAGPLRGVSEPFAHLAVTLLELLPVDSPELTSALRKLVEAKDCAVRTLVDALDSA